MVGKQKVVSKYIEYIEYGMYVCMYVYEFTRTDLHYFTLYYFTLLYFTLLYIILYILHTYIYIYITSPNLSQHVTVR